MILLISDLHLHEQRPDITRAFFRFLQETAVGAEALYILGDFFEVWIGDDAMTGFHHEVASALRQLTATGCKVYLMHGNRDFLLGEDFARATGGELLNEGTVVDLYGTPTLLMHGDSLCTKDEKYMAFREQVRNPEWQQMMLAKPLQERRMIAQMMRMQSQQSNANKADNIMDVTPEEVVREMEAKGVHQLIHGHTHRPDVHHVPLSTGNGQRWVLGDWGEFGWQIIIKPGAPFALERFPITP